MRRATVKKIIKATVQKITALLKYWGRKVMRKISTILAVIR